ncbi:hypothetical protein Tco_1571117 [Tanacetum coccineum]
MTLTNRCRCRFEANFQVSFMRILRLREVARMTARIALEFAPEFVYVCCMDFVECYLILLAKQGNKGTIEWAKEKTKKGWEATKVKAIKGLEAAIEAMGKKCDEAAIGGDKGVYAPEFNHYWRLKYGAKDQRLLLCHTGSTTGWV